MMRYIRYAILAVIAAVLLSMSLANRQAVTLSLLPESLAELFSFNMQVTLPAFLVVLAGVAVGVVVGFIWEWLREHKHRKEASTQAKEARKLKREVKKLKGEKHQGKDEVLALIDETA